eukprot:499552_1
MSSWQERHFILYDNNKLTYTQLKSKSSKTKQIDLRTVTKIETDDNNVCRFRGYSFGLCMHTPQRKWYFCFKTDKKRIQWKSLLDNCIQYNSIDNLVDDIILINNNTSSSISPSYTFSSQSSLNQSLSKSNKLLQKTESLANVVLNAKTENDLKSLIRHIQYDNFDKTNKIYLILLQQYPSQQNFIAYEKFLNNDDALLSFMKRHKFLVMPNILKQDKECYYILMKCCQIINYHIYSKHDMIEKHINMFDANDIEKSNENELSNLSSIIISESKEKDMKNMKKSLKNRRFSAPWFKRKSTNNELPELDNEPQLLRQTNSSKSAHVPSVVSNSSVTSDMSELIDEDFDFFAGLPVPPKGGMNLIEINMDENKTEENSGFIFRLLDDRKNEISQSIYAVQDWIKKTKTDKKLCFYEYSQYEIEEYVGLLLHKCGILKSDCSLNKIPIPWNNAINKQMMTDIDEDDDEDNISSLSEDVTQVLQDTFHEKHLSESTHRRSANNTPMFSMEFLQEIHQETQNDNHKIEKETHNKPVLESKKEPLKIKQTACTETCLDSFSQIVTGNNKDFPKQLNMIDGLLLIWMVYRCNCNHITFKNKQRVNTQENVLNTMQLKLKYIHDFIICLTREFFAELRTRKYMESYIVTLYYFASETFNTNDRIITETKDEMFDITVKILSDHFMISWKDKSRMIDFLSRNKWVETEFDKIKIENVLKKELNEIEKGFKSIYKEIENDELFNKIETKIKLTHGRVIFRQTDDDVLGKHWFDLNTLRLNKKYINKLFLDKHKKNNVVFKDDYNKGNNNENDYHNFERECAHFMIQTAHYLSNLFRTVIKNIFVSNKNDKNKHRFCNDIVNVYALNIKSLDLAMKEIESMEKSAKSKRPVSGSIRDFLCCVVVFPTVVEMLKGFRKLKECSKKTHSQYIFKICHIDNCLSKRKQANLLENFRYISINVIFGDKKSKIKMIAEICFTLEGIYKQIGHKQLIVDSYLKLIDINRVKLIEKQFEINMLSLRNRNKQKKKPNVINADEYEWRIKKLKQIKRTYTQTHSS